MLLDRSDIFLLHKKMFTFYNDTIALQYKSCPVSTCCYFSWLIPCLSWPSRAAKNNCIKVESKTNLTGLIKRLWLELERCSFLNIIKVVTVNLNVLVAALILLPKGDVELIINESPDDPYPAHLEAVLGQQGPNQLLEREKSPLGWYPRIRAGGISSWCHLLPGAPGLRWWCGLGELS